MHSILIWIKTSFDAGIEHCLQNLAMRNHCAGATGESGCRNRWDARPHDKIRRRIATKSAKAPLAFAAVTRNTIVTAEMAQPDSFQ